MKTRVTCILVAILLSAPAFSQRILIDWPSRSMDCPSEINSTVQSEVVVRDVNDLLYQYEVDFTAKARQNDDFRQLFGPDTESLASEPISKCQENVSAAFLHAKQLSDAFQATRGLYPRKEGDLYESVSLGETLADWRRFASDNSAAITQIKSLHDDIQLNCGEELLKWAADPKSRHLVTEWQQVQVQVDVLKRWELRTAEGAVHNVVLSRQLGPDVDYTVKVTERYKGVETVNGRKEFECRPASNVLTLSAGTLFSSMPVMEFRAVKAPNISTNDDGQPIEVDGTRDILAVDGSSMSVHAIGMLNYRLPGLAFGKGRGKDYGVTISSGPVFRLSGDTEASSIGYFAGVSVGLWNRLFITPGVHIGQFSDFPANFYEGRTIPDQFGALTPTKRWTGRFAIALSYRTNKLDRPGVEGTANNLPISDTQPAELKVVTKTLPEGSVGQIYTKTLLEASGGAGPYEWEQTEGSLPDGLELKDGEIGGTPTQAFVSPVPLRFQVKDKNGQTAVSEALTLVIK
ncbi:MAG: hypothetical protein WD733_24445 [Bryobacterales bacterium]